MKILKTWKDERYGAQNTIYKLPNGTKLFHSIDPKTVDSTFTIYTKGGGLYENSIGTTNGTAHFLEHVLATNPNRHFKTRKQIEAYEFGTRAYPKIHSNAWTSRFGIAFHASTHYKGEYRAIKRVFSMLDSDPDTFGKYIEKERKIILAELGQKDKPEKNAFLNYLDFVFGHLTEDYRKYVLGTEEDIKKISEEDLKTHYERIMSQDSVILALQSPSEISPKSRKIIDNIDKFFAARKNPPLQPIPNEDMQNQFKYKHFRDEKAANISIEIDTFSPNTLKQDYRGRALRVFSFEMIHYILFQELREKKGYIYSSNPFYVNSLLNAYSLKGTYFSTNIENFKKAVDEYQKIVSKRVHTFAKSKLGIKWLESQISGVIYPSTSEYNDDYASTHASKYLDGYELSDFEKFKKAVMSIKVEDILSYIQDEILNKPSVIWITSDREDQEIERIFKQTLLYKHQSSL
ncbi:MAG TPA: insulinase family protein [Candidatus Dojkabacteria bacterium]|nr:insulinase family protein [Candidatus Dojkabacteria bacterium]